MITRYQASVAMQALKTALPDYKISRAKTPNDLVFIIGDVPNDANERAVDFTARRAINLAVGYDITDYSLYISYANPAEVALQRLQEAYPPLGFAFEQHATNLILYVSNIPQAVFDLHLDDALYHSVSAIAYHVIDCEVMLEGARE